MKFERSSDWGDQKKALVLEKKKKDGKGKLKIFFLVLHQKKMKWFTGNINVLLHFTRNIVVYGKLTLACGLLWS